MEIIFKQYKRVGNGRSSKIYFDITVDELPPDDELMDAIYNVQIDMGYHPGGYGGPNDVKSNNIEIAEGLGHVHNITWNCFGSSD